MSWTHHFRILRDDVSNCFLGEKYEKIENGGAKFPYVSRGVQQVS